MGIVSSIIATVLNNYALARVQASNLSALGGISSIVSIILGFTVNHEQWRVNQLFGAAMIIIGAVGVNYITVKKSKI